MEARRVRTLESEDRLLLVAHRENRAGAIWTRAVAYEKFLGKPINDFPLFGARILRLVDQNVVDAAVELVVHPGRGLVGQEIEGLADEVVIVEKAACVLPVLVALDH